MRVLLITALITTALSIASAELTDPPAFPGEPRSEANFKLGPLPGFGGNHCHPSVVLARNDSQQAISLEKKERHLLPIRSGSLDQPVSWHAGAVWSEGNSSPTEAWTLAANQQLHSLYLAPTEITAK